jgi:hypothetical protein
MREFRSFSVYALTLAVFALASAENARAFDLTDWGMGR